MLAVCATGADAVAGDRAPLLDARAAAALRLLGAAPPEARNLYLSLLTRQPPNEGGWFRGEKGMQVRRRADVERHF